jgi:hypothetical protein
MSAHDGGGWLGGKLAAGGRAMLNANALAKVVAVAAAGLVWALAAPWAHLPENVLRNWFPRLETSLLLWEKSTDNYDCSVARNASCSLSI